MALLLVGGAYLVRRSLTSGDQAVVDTPVSQEDTATSAEEDANRTDNAADRDQGATHDDAATSGQSSGAEETPVHLPETGPADVILSGALLGGVAAAAIAYKRSRDLVASL